MVRSFRDALSESLISAAEKDSSIIVLSPDLARAVRIENYTSQFSDRYVSTGISEANTVGVAAGLASVGFTPVIVGFAMFVAEKPYEQIRNIIAYPHFNVKIIATHGGICVGKDGATHQAIEDLAIMRMLPGFTVMAASDVKQTKCLINEICECCGPAYLRLGRDKTEDLYPDDYQAKIGGFDLLRNGGDVAIFTVGTMTQRVLSAADDLQKAGVEASVANIYSIKPADVEAITALLKKCGCAVVAEDHLNAGGLFGLISETAARFCPTPIEPVGVDDKFGESGCEGDLYEKYGLTSDAVVKASIRAIKRRLDN